MIVIGFCGLPGSGKSTALEAISDLGIIITMGDIIRNEAKHRTLPLNDKNLGMIAKELRLLGGNEIIAEKTVNLIKTLNSEVVFVDGVRSLSELIVFRKNWKFPLITIETKKKYRYERILDRARSDDSKGEEFIRDRDEREINFGLNELIKAADYRISNNASIEDLKNKTRKLILKLIGKINHSNLK
jgi:dephospho-CoA kinase